MDEGRRTGVGEALGKVVSGVAVLTAADGPRRTGALVSWIQQVSFEPPMVMVAVKRGRPIGPLLTGGKVFALCVLAEDDNDLQRHFSRGYELDQDAFAGVSLETRSTGAPVVADAMAFLDCRLARTAEAGDHTLYLGEVVEGGLLGPPRRPMVHVRKTGFSY